jgi:hypothetical protein
MKVVSISTRNGIHHVAELVPSVRQRDGIATYKVLHLEPQPIYSLRKAFRVAEEYAKQQGITYMPFVRRGTPVDLVEEVQMYREAQASNSAFIDIG